MLAPTIIEKLEAVLRHQQELTDLMGRPEVATDLSRLQALARELAEMEEIAGKYREYQKVEADLKQAKELASSPLEEDMTALVKEEIEAREKRREALGRDIWKSLLPKDPSDARDVIVEIRAGAGGDEASLFAADLFRMYSRYAEVRGWAVEVIDASPNDLGGFKEIIFEVKGKGAFSRLKHERGVHRVQRVPVTEASGRIHTSTTTVAMLPEVNEVEVNINPDDLRIDIFHAGGHGGQNVNKVATAVRITHLPTGIVAVCQDERSQLKNKLKAMAVLRARIYDQVNRKQQEEITQLRRAQVGSGERSEKVRTYNFPQGRITDHRIGLTIHNLQAILDGDLDELIDALITHEQAQLLGARVG